MNFWASSGSGWFTIARRAADSYRFGDSQEAREVRGRESAVRAPTQEEHGGHAERGLFRHARFAHLPLEVLQHGEVVGHALTQRREQLGRHQPVLVVVRERAEPIVRVQKQGTALRGVGGELREAETDGPQIGSVNGRERPRKAPDVLAADEGHAVEVPVDLHGLRPVGREGKVRARYIRMPSCRN